LLRKLSGGRKYGRIAVIQALKKLPLDFRPLLGVKKGHNPKGIGLFLWGYVKLCKIDPRPEYHERIQYLIDLLDKVKNQGYSGACWGYNFDWQSRVAYLPQNTPTIVNSSFIGHALLDAYTLLGNKDALHLAISIGDFIIKDLNRDRQGDAICFSYSPTDRNFVHNANLLGASLLIRLSHLTGVDELRNTALSSLRYTMERQRDDGSWFYAEPKMQNWIDSFHTGFNLQAIRYFLELGEAKQYENSYKRGVKFYAGNFFLSDGTPKYYHNRVYPIDIHAPAEAIVFFSSEGEQYCELTDRVLNWTLVNMYNPKGYFYFRKGRRFTNKIPYIRWGQAWMFHALTEYNIHLGEGSGAA
jgi:hypothetical protein